MTQAQAARLAGWGTTQCWHKLELRDYDVRVGTLVILAQVLHCNLQDILVSKPVTPRRKRRKRRRSKGMGRRRGINSSEEGADNLAL